MKQLDKKVDKEQYMFIEASLIEPHSLVANRVVPQCIMVRTAYVPRNFSHLIKSHRHFAS